MREKIRVCCLVACAAIIGLLFAGCGTARAFNSPNLSSATIVADIPGEDAVQPLSAEILRREAIPPEALETERLLKNLIIPACNYRDITMRLADPGVPIPEVVNSTAPDYKVGDKRQFSVMDVDVNKYYSITAKLVYKTGHAYVWLEDGAKASLKYLKAAADRWEKTYYSTDRAFFGSEWTPGVDNDVRISWLISNKMGENAAGYYGSNDEYSRLVNKFSNEMEIFYLNSENNPAEDPYFNGVLVHEFAHMIEWYHHANQANWIDEGLAELACQINGMDPGSKKSYFAANPDLQLNAWPELDSAYAHYGASYMFMSYYLDRFGKAATQALVTSKSYSTAAVDEALKANKFNTTFDRVFAEWTVANYINNPKVGQGEYSYRTIKPDRFSPIVKLFPGDYPAEITTSVAQYGTDYVELYGKGELEIKFVGDTLVGLTPAKAHSGKYMWWGGSNNNSDATLTQTFDLTAVKKATLTFWTWYDIEKDYDYAYVEVSTDGQHWLTLPGQHTTAEDPVGANYGFGYTGQSVPDKPKSDRWVQEKIDLSQFAGKKIQVRFEYITDAGVTKAGFFLDDIEIPEIGYRHNAESDNGGWEARGFVRNANILPQHWSVQLITVGEKNVSVEMIPISENGIGKWTARLNMGEVSYGILVISGLTPVTYERTHYVLTVRPK